MARRTDSYVCQNCGAHYGRWQGKCDACNEWNTITEEGAERPVVPGRAPRKGRRFALEPLAGESQDAPRLASGIAEFDRVTGGGFVRGSVLLLGGDIGVDELGTACGTIGYEVLTSLGKRYHRNYRD